MDDWRKVLEHTDIATARTIVEMQLQDALAFKDQAGDAGTLARPSRVSYP